MKLNKTILYIIILIINFKLAGQGFFEFEKKIDESELGLNVTSMDINGLFSYTLTLESIYKVTFHDTNLHLYNTLQYDFGDKPILRVFGTYYLNQENKIIQIIGNNSKNYIITCSPQGKTMKVEELILPENAKIQKAIDLIGENILLHIIIKKTPSLVLFNPSSNSFKSIILPAFTEKRVTFNKIKLFKDGTIAIYYMLKTPLNIERINILVMNIDGTIFKERVLDDISKTMKEFLQDIEFFQITPEKIIGYGMSYYPENGEMKNGSFTLLIQKNKAATLQLNEFTKLKSYNNRINELATNISELNDKDIIYAFSGLWRNKKHEILEFEDEYYLLVEFITPVYHRRIGTERKSDGTYVNVYKYDEIAQNHSHSYLYRLDTSANLTEAAIINSHYNWRTADTTPTITNWVGLNGNSGINIQKDKLYKFHFLDEDMKDSDTVEFFSSDKTIHYNLSQRNSVYYGYNDFYYIISRNKYTAVDNNKKIYHETWVRKFRKF